MSPPSPAIPSANPLWEAFHEPETFILRWHNAGRSYGFVVFLSLALIAVLGTGAYGALLGVSGNASRVLECALLFTASAALSWAAPLPAVYILNSMSGSRLRFDTTFLASLLTAACGGLGFVVLLPITVVVLLSVSNHWIILAAHLAAFAVVGFCMAIVYNRLQVALEPHRGGGRSWWLWLFILLQVALLNSWGLVRFSPPV